MRILNGVVLFALVGCGHPPSPLERQIAEAGYVPDAVTAARVAEAICIPIFGAEKVESEKPLKAVLVGEKWVVTGKDLPPDSVGGVLEVHILRKDGRILWLTHWK
jgi:hypothetical protein